MADLLKQVNNRYLLVNVIAQRTREIALASEAAGECLEKKPISYAVDEIAAGKINVHSICKNETA
jgi:DNA-directed RNA polymerase omega subunit